VANLEDESDTGKIVESPLAVALRIDEGVRSGKFRRKSMVIDDDDVDTLGAEPGDLLDSGGAAIDGDEERGFVFLDAPFNAVLAEAVAFLHAEREESLDLGTELFQDTPEERAGGDAIHIVIAEDDHFFARGDGAEDALGCDFEIGELERIAEGLQARIKERADLIRGVETALPEERGDLGMEIQSPGQFQRLSHRRRFYPALAEGA